MKLINDNLKKAGIFNSILIVLAIVLELLTIKEALLFEIIDISICVIGLLFGLLYSLNGYKKDVAKYYKWFMYLFALRSIISFIVSISKFGFDSVPLINLIHIINFVILICVCLLAFVKDFGEHNSKTAACIILVLTGIRLFSDISYASLKDTHYATLAIFVQAIITYVLVSQKYADKESRGAK